MVTDNYLKLARANLKRLYGNLPGDLEMTLPAEKAGQTYAFTAFGQTFVISPEGITLDGVEPPGVISILLSLYALNATIEREEIRLSLGMERKPETKSDYKVEATNYALKRKQGRVWYPGAPVRFYGFPDEVVAYHQNASATAFNEGPARCGRPIHEVG